MKIECESLRLHTDENHNTVIRITPSEGDQVDIALSLDQFQLLREQIESLFAQRGGGGGLG